MPLGKAFKKLKDKLSIRVRRKDNVAPVSTIVKRKDAMNAALKQLRGR